MRFALCLKPQSVVNDKRASSINIEEARFWILGMCGYADCGSYSIG